MPDALTPSAADPAATALRARQKKMLGLSVGLLVLCAVALVVLPLTRVPFFARAFLAAFDLVIAATLWLFGRQHLAGK